MGTNFSRRLSRVVKPSTPGKEKQRRYASQWFDIAADDFRRVVHRMKEGDVEDAAFHLQQALEKYLKGFLLSRGWQLKRIHDLEALLDDAVAYNSCLEPYRPLCQQVTGYYLVERYPAFEAAPSAKEVRSAYEKAEPLVRLLRHYP